MRMIDADMIYQDLLPYSNKTREFVMKIINAQPTVEPQPKVGEWKYIEYIESSEGEGHTYGECSKCHKVRIIDNYCPNCGSYNRGSEE